MLLGTPGFVAPEQARDAKSVDARADIWAMGVVLYRLLSGELPFRGESLADVLAAILVQPHAPMRARRPELPLELEAIVSRCLAKERDLRFANVAELASALGPYASADGRGFVERVCRVLGVSAAAQTLIERNKLTPAAAPSPIVGAVTQAQPTAASWTHSSVAQFQRRSANRRRIVWGAGALVALGVAVGVMARVSHDGGLAHAPSTMTPTSLPAPQEPAPLQGAVLPTREPPAPTAASPIPAPELVIDSGTQTPPETTTPSLSPTPRRPTSTPTPTPTPTPTLTPTSTSTPSPKPRPSRPSAPSPSARAYDVLDQRN